MRTKGRPPARRLFRLGLGRPRPRDAVDWEIEHHLAELADRLVDQGWVPEAAAREAERRFGGVKAYRRRLGTIERRRERMARWTGWTVAVGEAVAGSLRALRRQPGLSAAVVLTLGLGVGANAAMFTILDRLFFEPPAHVEDADGVRLVLVRRSAGALGEFTARSLAHPDLTDLDAHEGLASWAAYQPTSMTLEEGGETRKVDAVIARHTLFPLLGVHAARGRFYGEDDDRPDAERVAVVSHEFWRGRLGGDPDVLGRTLTLGGEAFTVVGVAPAGFTGVELAPVDVWLPLETGGTVARRSDSWRGNRGWYWLRGVVRLRDGVTVEAAEAQATALHRAGRSEQIDEGRYDKEAEVVLDPLILARGSQATAESKVARWLGGVSLLLLVIVCANVANLLLARGSRRQRESAVRLALGGSGRRLVGQTVLETALLGLLGSAVALALAYWGGAAIRNVLLPGVLFPVALGARVVAVAVGLALLAGALAGLAPGLQATRLDLARDLGQGNRGVAGRSFLRDALTVGQAALSVLLLVGAGLFVRSVREVRTLDLGLDADRLVEVTLELDIQPLHGLQGQEARRETARRTNEVFHDALRRVRGVAGVERAAASEVPFGWSFAADLEVMGRDSLPDLAGGGPYYHDVTPGYFETMGLRVVAGRPLLDTDDAGGEKVAWVGETMARAVWPDEDPLGACMLVDEEEDCTTVVGVVEDAARSEIQEEPHMTYYLPAAQRDDRSLAAVFARTPDDPREVAGRMAAALRGMDPRVRFVEVQTLREMLDPQARSWTLGASLFTVFGILALVVAGIGLYGLLAFHVAERTRELGIRSALGAAKGVLLAGVVGDGLRLTALGVGLGIALALALGRFAEPLLFHTSSRDPVVLATVVGTLLAVGLVASLLPGVRATRVDPMDALRSE